VRGRAKYVLIRVAGLLGTLLVTSFLVFSLIYIAPGDPINFLIRGKSPSPEAIAAIKAQYALDQPFFQQYLHWLGGVLHGDFGRSFEFRESVSSVIADRAPTTLYLVAYSAVIILVFGLITGIWGALRQGRLADKVTLVLSTVLAAIPSFVAAILLISVFAVRLGMFPTFGSGDGGFLDTVYHLTLPAIALSLTFIALLSRVTRSSMLEELSREHVEVATSRGDTRSAVVRRHVIRNALGPITTISGLLIAGLLVSTSVIESAFGITGIGSLLVTSVNKSDFPVVQAVTLIVVATFVIVNLVVDMLQPWIDPRIAAGTASR
jgi:peptide/nickel transport system permease protein